jgi:TRAP-type C4-dicarboxylate transport system permease small subunit
MDRVLSILCIILSGGMTLGVIISVFLRYVFNLSFVAYEEAITLTFIATTYFGAALGVREKQHIAVTYLEEISPPRIKTVLRFINILLIIVISAVVIKYGLLWIEKVGGVESPAIHIPYKYFYSIVPISFAIMIFYAIVNMVAIFLPIASPDKGYESDDELPKPNHGGTIE